MLILRRQNQRFETLIQNADPKRPSREYCSCFPREEDDFVSMHCALFEAIVRAQVNRKGVYMTSFKHVQRLTKPLSLTQHKHTPFHSFVSLLKISLYELNKSDYNSILSHTSHTCMQKEELVLIRVFMKIMDATAFCSNHVWKRWFWPLITVISNVYAKCSKYSINISSKYSQH